MRPRIGITCSYQITRADNGYEWPRLTLDARFCDAVYRAGGLPVIIPPAPDPADLELILEPLAGVILTGGPDVPSERYGMPPHPETKPFHPRRDASDFTVAAFADRRELPVLAICCGIQEWNVHRGGTLHPHLPDCDWQPRVVHRDSDTFAAHPVRLAEGSLVHRIVAVNPLAVNSSHHQGLDRLGENLVPTAWSEDGLVEAVEDPRRPFCLGVQWHPEDMPDDPLQQKLLAALVIAARSACDRS